MPHFLIFRRLPSSFTLSLTTLSFVLILSSHLSAQGEANQWYFGLNAGLDFNTNPPTVLNDGALIAPEGVASIADRNGQLLFYTNGEVIYNADHEIMTNGTGLAGQQIATQAALIVPKPLSDHLYYVFTLGANGGFGTTTDGLSYSVVDMNFSNGKGAVVEKNIRLLDNVAEKQRAIPHANGRDFWLVAHGFDSNVFYSFLVSCQGVQLQPMVSRVGRLQRETNAGCCQGYTANGAMAVAPNHQRLALAWNEVISFSLTGALVGRWHAEVFDFNPRTGRVGNGKAIDNENGINAFVAYGIAFSPNSKKMYLSVEEDSPRHQLLQFDLTAPTLSDARTTIASTSEELRFGALELGPDNRIYVAREGQTANFLSVIQQPNQSAEQVDYLDVGIDLESGRSRLGLPNTLFDYSSTPFYDFFPSDTLLCFDEVLQLDLDTLNATTYLWDDGNTFAQQNITTEGLHWLEIETETCGNGRDSIQLAFQDCTCRVVFPNAFSPNDDGANDVFAPVLANCDYSTYVLNIYSRNGDLVFSTTDPTAGWNGELKGRNMPNATYVYYLLYKNPKEKGLKRIAGTLSLMR